MSKALLHLSNLLQFGGGGGGCTYIYLFLARNSGHLHRSCYWVVQWSWFAQVNVLCNLLCKKSQEVAASFLGWFLSRRCFTLCITMEAECRIMKKYKCCSCKSYWGKGMEGRKKVSLHRFLADQKIASSWKKCVLGHPIAQATSYCLLSDTFW